MALAIVGSRHDFRALGGAVVLSERPKMGGSRRKRERGGETGEGKKVREPWVSELHAASNVTRAPCSQRGRITEDEVPVPHHHPFVVVFCFFFSFSIFISPYVTYSSSSIPFFLFSVISERNSSIPSRISSVHPKILSFLVRSSWYLPTFVFGKFFLLHAATRT